jgi:hypothetical protein
MAGITFRNVKVEISVDGGAVWTNISGQTNSLTVGGGDREIGTFFDAANDTPTLGAGKRSELTIQLRVKYSEADSEAQGILQAAYENSTETMVRYSPKGGASGDRLYTSEVKTPLYPGQEVQSGDPLRHEIDLVVPKLTKSLVA